MASLAKDSTHVGLRVLFMGDGIKMIWIATGTSVTEVINFLTLGDRTLEELIADTVNTFHLRLSLAPNADSAIALGYSSSPEPTPTWGDDDLFQ